MIDSNCSRIALRRARCAPNCSLQTIASAVAVSAVDDEEKGGSRYCRIKAFAAAASLAVGWWSNRVIAFATSRAHFKVTTLFVVQNEE